jgi:hypothetical protein
MGGTLAAKNKRKTRALRAAGDPLPEESRAAEAVTVAWMLSTLATFAAELAAVAAWAVVGPAVDDQLASPLSVLPRLLLLIAAVAGSVSLLLAPITYRVRLVSPPRAITIIAVLVGIAPLIVLVLVSRVANQ